MLEGSFWELSFIFLIALVVFGPERLPGLARSLGLWVGKARATLRGFNEQIERELAAAEMRKHAAEVKQAVQPEAFRPADESGGGHDGA